MRKVLEVPGHSDLTFKESNMMYGLLLEGALAEEQQEAAQQANQNGYAEEDFWFLGMEAWVRCDNVQAD